jgi:long-chain fatty acid transport protein
MPFALQPIRTMTAVAALTALPLCAQGIVAPEPSARAAGLGGAVTAQVNDASAIFYNPGALALLQKKKGAAAGVTTTKPNELLYQGLAPGAGAGTAAEQTTKTTTLPFLFATVPLGKHFVTGASLYTPLRIDSEWRDPASYAGRFLATSSRLTVTDVAIPLALKAGDAIGLGGTFIYRTSQIEASRRVSAALAGTAHDVATLDMKTDSVRAYGWSAGLLIRPGSAFSIGASYRSRIAAKYNGAGQLTQIPTNDAQFDQLVAATFPFGRDLGLNSSLEFPAEERAGVAFGLGKAAMLELDATRTDWSGVNAIGFLFPATSILDTTYPLRLKNATSYRAGLRFQFPTGPQLRFGYAVSRSPQPNETVGAFLADADRNTITAGFGLDWLDLAVGYTKASKRQILTNVDALNGIYRGTGWSLTIGVTK